MALVNTDLRSANRGLITEVNPLSLPSDASVDEQNMEMSTNTARPRRKGIAYESANVASTFTVDQGTLITNLTWSNVGGVANRQFVVLQVGATLYFYDKTSDPISAGEKSFTVDLNTYDAGNDKTLADNRISGDSLNGVFVVVHPGCEPFFIQYDVNTDTISTTQITPKIRDFEWQGDTSTYATQLASGSTSDERKYDTKNSGWDDSLVAASTKPLATYIANQSAYPPLNTPWYSGKNSSGVFNVTEFHEIYTGNSLSGNGHYILDFFAKDRNAIESGLPIETEASRFSSVVAFAGRFWYAGLESTKNSGKVLFTKVIVDDSDYGFCYQENDPTSEDISDLLASDGGEINIPDAHGISYLFSVGTNLLVFASNGVWVIKGVDGVFKATEYSVSKISSFGLISAGAFVNANRVPFWWSEIGIHSVQPNPVSGEINEQNIALETIQTFYNNIDASKKLQVQSAYDEINQKIMWMYPDNDEVLDYKYNKILLYDIRNQAFIPWTVSDQSTNTDYIVSAFYTPSLGAISDVQDVTENGVTVTQGGITVTWDAAVTLGTKDSSLKFFVRQGSTGNLTVAQFGDNDFLDWGDTNYSSYVELGYNFYESLAVRKSPVKITTYFNRTEDGWDDNGDGSFTPRNESGCQLEVFWDLNNTASSTQNVYRLKRLPVVDEGNLSSFPYPDDMVINKTRIKGRGYVSNFKFSSEQGKDFQFYGYSVTVNRHDSL